MKTVKQLAELSGVSVRTLQYYDEIGVFKPTKVTDSGYRLYDDEAVKVLQQILFFKELDFQLNEIKKIMADPQFNKTSAFKKQKELITAKRDRLNRLLGLLEKLEKGETCMSFQEFDMSEYIAALEKFKDENAEEVCKNWGSIDAFEKFVADIKEKESDVAQIAIKQYGSIEKYTEAMKDNLAHFSATMEKMKQGKVKYEDTLEKSKALTKELVSDLSADVTSPEIQSIIQQLVQMNEEMMLGINMGENFWNMTVEGYLHEGALRSATDRQYGAGASIFIGRAYQHYFHNKIETV